MKKTSSLSFRLPAIAALALAGCNHSTGLNFNPLPFASLEPQVFEDTGSEFRNVQIILWKEDVPAKETVQSVIELSNQLEKIQGQIDPIQSRLDEIERSYGSLFNQQSSLNDKIASANNKIGLLGRKLDKQQSERAVKLQALADEYARETQDPDKIKALRADCDAMKAQVDKTQADIATIQKQIAGFQADLEKLAPQLASIAPERERLQSEDKPLTEQSREVIGKLSEITEFPAQNPTFLIFPAEDGHSSPRIKMKDWDLSTDNMGPITFDSLPSDDAAPNIVDVKYSAWGGVLEFTACVYQDETQAALSGAYHFHLARVAYDKEGIHYAGEITFNEATDLDRSAAVTCSQIGSRKVSGSTRYGIAKISDIFN